MHMLLVIAFLEKVNYGGNFSPKVYGDIYSLKMLNQILNKVDFIKEYS